MFIPNTFIITPETIGRWSPDPMSEKNVEQTSYMLQTQVEVESRIKMFGVVIKEFSVRVGHRDPQYVFENQISK